MNIRIRPRRVLAIAMLAMSLPLAVYAGDDSSTDGLSRVEMRGVDQTWVAPEAHLDRYKQVLIESAAVSFRDNWARDFNRSSPMPGRKLRDKDLQKIATEMGEAFDQEYAKAFRDAGYEIVTAAGPNVLRLSPELSQLYLNNPPIESGSRGDIFVVREGEATLVIEARDAQTGHLLALSKDNRETRDVNVLRRSDRVFTLSDFRELFQAWGDHSADSLNKLHLQPAIAAN